MIGPGMMISDRYEIIDKVGSGGMADVYKAKDHRLNRFVAIKVLRQEYSSDAKFVAKFRAEAQSVAGLSHPNIVNVYDVDEDENYNYIVMELVEGITLKKFIEKKESLMSMRLWESRFRSHRVWKRLMTTILFTAILSHRISLYPKRAR